MERSTAYADTPLELTVETRPPYPVFVGPGALARLADAVAAPRRALIADETVFAHHGERVLAALGGDTTPFVVPPGEASKGLSTYARLLSDLARAGFDRRSAVVALGGGVAGDLAGFVAASYLRGVAFYQLPTSLLAMVDSSVGGKTGVNLPEGKNLVGAFWQPKAVGVDPSFLRTLPERTFREGAVELFKAGLLADESILRDMSDADFRPDGDPNFLTGLIARGVRVKAEVVAADELEQGARAHLNLGHTLGHALEAATDHALSHGDAVAYGLYFAAALAAGRGYSDLTGQVRGFLDWLEPTPLPDLELSDLLPYMARDKKTQGGTLRFVLLRAPGKPELVDDLAQAELAAAWHALKGLR